MSDIANQAAEKQALLRILERRRQFLLSTATGLTDEQARTKSTISSLTIGGLIKHNRLVEAQWVDFAQRGGAAFEQAGWDELVDEPGEAIATGATESTDPTSAPVDGEWESGDQDWAAVWEAQNALAEDETLADVVAALLDQGAATARVVTDLDLDSSHPLPEAPWFEPGTVWSGRDVVLHVIAELAHHSGHADIIREGIDGAKTMG